MGTLTREGTSPHIINFHCRHEDTNTAAVIMRIVSGHWLGIRGEALSTFLVTSVSAGALFALQSPGRYTIETDAV